MEHDENIMKELCESALIEIKNFRGGISNLERLIKYLKAFRVEISLRDKGSTEWHDSFFNIWLDLEEIYAVSIDCEESPDRHWRRIMEILGNMQDMLLRKLSSLSSS